MLGNWNRLGGILGNSILAFSLLAGVFGSILAQHAAPSTENETHRDSSQAERPARVTIATVLQRLRPGFDAGYHTPPIHPYFRDDQRAVHDMRRLVSFVDKNVLRGFESIPELVEMARKLSAAKQTAIIRFAIAGSIANLTVDQAMKQLRRHKLNFVQLEVDRIRFQTAFQGTHVSFTHSLEAQVFTISHPKLRASYSHAAYPTLVSHSFNFSPLSRLALNYTRWHNLDIFGFNIAPLPRLSLSYTIWNGWEIFSANYGMAGGGASISHDHTRKITLTGWRWRHNKNSLGIFYFKDWLSPAPDSWRCDWLLVW